MAISFSLIRILVIMLMIFSASFLSMQSVHADPTPIKLASRLSPPPPPEPDQHISPIAAEELEAISPVVA